MGNTKKYSEEELKQHKHEYYLRNKEKMKQQIVAARDKNIEAYNEYHRDYYEDNKEKIRKYQKDRYQNNKEKMQEYYRKQYQKRKISKNNSQN